MTKFYGLIFIILLGTSILKAQNCSIKQGGHSYTMCIPDYLTRTFKLNNVASLQYQNTSKEVYVVVIHDTKEELEQSGMKFINARDFLDNFTKDYQKDAKKRKLGNIVEFVSNDNGHAQVELTWKEDDIDFSMLITAVETKKAFYKILAWTILENKDKFKSDFIEMSKSIKD